MLATSARFVFAPFELDPARHRLTASGEPVAISERQLDVLLLLVARAGQIISKDDLLHVGWKDVAVGDNSLEQAISGLRRVLGTHPSGVAYIETVPRRGYRFGVPVTRLARRESDAELDALLAPHRAFIEGRAALETLEVGRVARAREIFESALRSAPDHASAHVGLANAYVMQFEMTRADPAPDAVAVALHSLLGLIHLARGDETRALEEFERELSFENAGQLYARECAANTWYAIGALRLRQGRPADASAAFARAIERVPMHPMARVGLVAAGSIDPIAPPHGDIGTGQPALRAPSVDAAVWQAARLVIAGAHTEAARIVGEAKAGAAAGNAGWLLPIEPLLHVTAHPDIWARALAHLRNRAA